MRGKIGVKKWLWTKNCRNEFFAVTRKKNITPFWPQNGLGGPKRRPDAWTPKTRFLIHHLPWKNPILNTPFLVKFDNVTEYRTPHLLGGPPSLPPWRPKHPVESTPWNGPRSALPRGSRKPDFLIHHLPWKNPILNTPSLVKFDNVTCSILLRCRTLLKMVY